MRLSLQQLESINGRLVPDPFDAVLERLGKIESALLLPRDNPGDEKPSLESVVERLDKIEAAMFAKMVAISNTRLEKLEAAVARLAKLAAVKSGYKFTIERDGAGQMTSVVAKPSSVGGGWQGEG